MHEVPLGIVCEMVTKRRSMVRIATDEEKEKEEKAAII